jgi:hypothetical protein
MEQGGIGENTFEPVRKSCSQTSQPLYSRAIAANRGDPSSPTGAWPSSRSVFRSRPGPQPRSRIANGGFASICFSSAAMFWLTS